MRATKIIACGYSYHDKPFQTGHPEGLHGYLFRLQTEGSCRALVDGKMERIEAGDLLLYKPDDSYLLDIFEPSDVTGQEAGISSGDYFVFCSGTWLDEWWKQCKRPQKIRIIPEEGLLAAWRALMLERRRLKEENPKISDYLLRALCLGIDRAIAVRTTMDGQKFIAARMKHYIDQRVDSSFQIKDIAKHVGLSESRTIRLFKECYGMTIIQYTLNARLLMAEDRIKYSTMTLEQIAETCGFGSYTYFYRVFREKYGMAPSAYRERSRHAVL